MDPLGSVSFQRLSANNTFNINNDQNYENVKLKKKKLIHINIFFTFGVLYVGKESRKKVGIDSVGSGIRYFTNVSSDPDQN